MDFQTRNPEEKKEDQLAARGVVFNLYTLRALWDRPLHARSKVVKIPSVAERKPRKSYRTPSPELHCDRQKSSVANSRMTSSIINLPRRGDGVTDLSFNEGVVHELVFTSLLLLVLAPMTFHSCCAVHYPFYSSTLLCFGTPD
jgi:hypothetical protein